MSRQKMIHFLKLWDDGYWLAFTKRGQTSMKSWSVLLDVLIEFSSVQWDLNEDHE